MSAVLGWKVVWHSPDEDGDSSHDKHRWSAWLGQQGVQYVPGEWAAPWIGWGPLCVFDAYSAAVAWMSQRLRWPLDGYWEIWRCEYEPAPEEAVWTGLYGSSDRVPLWRLPSETRLARRVRLLHRAKAEGVVLS